MSQGSGVIAKKNQEFRLSDELIAKLSQPTIPLAEAGRLFFNMGPTATRAAAAQGDLPSIRIGKKLFCPTAPLRALLCLDGPQQAA